MIWKIIFKYKNRVLTTSGKKRNKKKLFHQIWHATKVHRSLKRAVVNHVVADVSVVGVYRCPTQSRVFNRIKAYSSRDKGLHNLHVSRSTVEVEFKLKVGNLNTFKFYLKKQKKQRLSDVFMNLFFKNIFLIKKY